MIPVVIGSHPKSPWLADLLHTIPTGRHVYVHRDGGYELTALRQGIERYNTFLFLQDSTRINTPLFWDTIDGLDGPAWLFGWPGMYLGVYTRDTLQPVLTTTPPTVDKETSIEWEHRIRHLLHYPVLWDDVTDATGHIEHKHGRPNLVLENEFLTKWKGTWR